MSYGGCGYYHYAGPLAPASQQRADMQVNREGLVTFQRGDLLIQMRAITDRGLNQQFASHSEAGPESTNPYTFGDTRFWDGDAERTRFTVFHLRVANEGFPKVKVDPARVVMETPGGRQYWSLSLQQLDSYYRAYATGFRGSEYARYQERLDILRRTLFRNEEVFDGQTAEGYLVFPVLHHDVKEVSVQVLDAVLRFDHRSEPQETAELTYRFHRETGRLFRDGRLALETD
ncbi:MAG: hypothetical protein VX948_12820 [Candidatus Latescibacterota bacterium]|nr:hypothetical protein [Candidatus Latescibacterota bacterium]